jgi:predicted ribosome quality control (RQC) complex YloA/Tae2 family protein
MENLGKRTGTTDPSISNRVQKMEERISAVEDTIEETDASIKENVKSKNFLTKNIQEIWNTMKRPNLRL